MPISPSPQQVYADGPEGSPQEPYKPDVRRIWKQTENAIDAFSSGAGSIAKQNRADLYGDLAHAADTTAWVYNDSNVYQNGIYRKAGASGTGSWYRILDLPFSFIIASNVGAGTANAIQAVTPVAVSNSALVWLNITATNTGPVTVSFNGSSALAVKTNSGHDVGAGGLIPGMMIIGIVIGSTFRIFNDEVSSAIVASAEAARDASEAARDQAQYYAGQAGSGVGVPAQILDPSGYTFIPTSLTMAERARARGISWMEGGVTGGVRPGKGDANADTAAIQNILGSFPARGGKFLIPAWGTGGEDTCMLINDRVDISGLSLVSIRGESESRSYVKTLDPSLYGKSNKGFLSAAFATPAQIFDNRVELCDFSVMTNYQDAGTAIDIRWAEDPGNPGHEVGSPVKAFSIRNVALSTEGKADPHRYFNVGLRVTHGREGEIYGLTGFGADPDLSSGSMSLSNMSNLVSFEGNSVGIVVAFLHAYNMCFPISIVGKCEGIYILKPQLVTCIDAVSIDADSDYVQVCLNIDGMHSNALRGAIRAEGASDVNVFNCSFQKRDESTLDYADITALGRCNTWKVFDNDLRLRGSGGTEDFIVTSGTGNDLWKVHDNQINNRDKIWNLDANVTNFDFRDNTRGPDVTSEGVCLSTSGTNLFVGSEVDVTVPNLTANVAVPSVGGFASFDAELIVHTNSNANTTITGLAGIKKGRKYAIRLNEGFTALAHGANMVLAGAVNVDRPSATPANLGKTIHFIAMSDTQLVEIGRS